MGLVDPNGNDVTKIPDSDFKCEVFINKETGKTIVAYRGTTASWEDVGVDVAQSRGKETGYYNQALLISDTLSDQPPGSVEYVGHSMGGGLAAASAEKNGGPATTFNAAGVHENTVVPFERKEGDPTIRAVHVDGEALSGAQDNSLGLAPEARGERIVLQPDNDLTVRGIQGAGMVVGSFAGPKSALAVGAVAKGLQLHRMVEVVSSLGKVSGNINAMQKHKGC